MRSDCIHIADCGIESLYFCRMYCRGAVYKAHKCKHNKLGIAFGGRGKKAPTEGEEK